MKLETPRLVGFGISDHESFEKVSGYAAGAIIGSAIIHVLGKGGDIRENLLSFIRSVKGNNNY